MEVTHNTQMIRTIHFTKGETIIKKGDKSRGIFYIKKGVARNINSGILYGDNKKFKFFGILSFVSEGERTSTVTAETDCQVLEIDPDILKSHDSLFTLINDLLKETAQIIITDEKMITEREKEIVYLQNRIDEMEKELRNARK